MKHLLHIITLIAAIIICRNVVCADESESPQLATLSPIRVALRELCAEADSGYPEAQYRLAYLHDIGYDSIPIDTARSTFLYTQSADAGYIPAMNYLGFRLYSGLGVKRDINKGIDYIERAAMAGDPHAASNMGWLLFKGDGVKHDIQKGIYWLEKAANADVPQAQGMLADILSDTLYVAPDTLRAIPLYEAAAAAGVPDAARHLVAMMSKKWESLPADSALNLGIRYYTHGIPSAAIPLFQRAATLGNSQALALLGDAYTRALGVEYDYNLALAHFLKAALTGNPAAQFYLAELLEIFPDALQNPGVIEIAGIENPLPREASTPQYWYDLSHSAGISNAEEAFASLLSQSVK